ncbi:MAG: polysaccharide biosynthesis tyrosine autokinase [Coriobacteriia bacterium]|nr:polysaccharide biosynthesis tyrosine autokinase [Coriobacteriia bacterium]
MELRDYINVIRARKWVIVQAVVIVTLVALAASLLQAKMYEGSAQVLVSEKDTAAVLLGSSLPNLSTQPERDMATQVELMQMRPIAEATIKTLGLQTTPEELLKRVSVKAVGQTNLIEISADDPSPEQAAKIANAMANEYVMEMRDANRASIATAADEVQKRLDEAKAEILALGQKIHVSGETSDVSAELQIATGTYSTLAEKLETLEINKQLETGPGRVVSPAVPDDRAISPKPARDAGIGLLVGLVFGLGMAFLYEYLDNTLKSTDEVEKYFGAPVLGTIPVDKLEKGEKRRLAIVEAPGSSTSEAYRALRNSLEFVNFQHDMKTLLVTSAAPNEGKSTVAANLAAALAQAGKRVTLVSVDFRRPTTQQFFNVNNMVGLSEVLLGTHSLKAALQRPGDEQLLVLTAGKMPPNPSELLGSTKMEEVIKALGEWGEWVIIDSPPLLAVADPAAVARWADGVVLVSKAGVTTRDAARKATELLAQVGAHTTGVVVWGLDESKAGTSGYGYYGNAYYYSSYYSQASDGALRGGKKGKAEGSDGEQSGQAEWAPEQSAGRRFASALGRILTGVLAFLLVIAILAIVLYFLDQYMGWGLASQVVGLWR